VTRELLIGRLKALAESCTGLFEACPPSRLDWRPAPRVRSLQELGDHFAAAPLVDLAVMQGNPRQVTEAIEEALHGAGPADWTEVFERGVRAVVEFFGSLDDEAFASKMTRAHYGTARTPAEWLMEALSHVAHHRGQLYLYLRMLGAPVGPEALYT
jgi:uncharacterized damage-inducible protein DinB